jgi:hypothetical protein
MLIKLANIDPELYMRSTFSLLVLLFTSLGVVADDRCKALSQLQWMLGDWQTRDIKSPITESWNQVSEYSFEGQGQQLDIQGEVKSQESLRLLEMQDSIFYLAKVTQNLLPTAFKAVRCNTSSAVFENTQHDFPTRLTYHLIDSRLSVKVEGLDGKGFTVNFDRK